MATFKWGHPIRPQEMDAVRAANVLMGTDKDCRSWIRNNRDQSSATAGEAAAQIAESGGRRRGGREGRRRAV